ncbi:MAG: hypothetical protein SFU87_16125 [Chitinophagaceae bacterium]|nr:hypothetical protein [Chitinophagaceae bacterium]
MEIKYFPNEGIEINGSNFKWGSHREIIRELLGQEHKSADSVIDVSEYFEGDTKHNIEQRRDVYENYKQSESYFFLNYDNMDTLKEVEIHKGNKIIIEHITIDFSMKLSEVINRLKLISDQYVKLKSGYYFFKNIKVTITDAKTLGGKGSILSYFYCAASTKHLENE